MENPYAKAPFQVTIYDALRGGVGGSWMLLGATPRNVLAAARRIRRGKDDEAALRAYYGPSWRAQLTPDVALHFDGRAKRAGPATGGADPDFGDLGDFDADPDLDPAPGAAPGAVFGEKSADDPGGPAGGPGSGPSWDATTRYEPLAVYPEDTFADLKDKIHVAAGIPPYRQHLFYSPASGSVETTYRLTLEGGRVVTDIRALAAAGEAGRVAGVPVDRRLEERREDLQVIALDTFRTLGGGAGTRRVFVADLDDVLRGAGGRLAAAIADRYEADLLYYGLCLKYWPSLSPSAFHLAATDGAAAVAAAYPLLAPPLKATRERLAAEQELLDRTYARGRRVLAELKPPGGRVAVTEATVAVEPSAARARVNIRNVFDWLATSPRVPGAVARLPLVAEAARGRQEAVATKRHVSAAAPRALAALAPFFDNPPRRPGVAYALARRPTSDGGGGGRDLAPRFVYLTLFADGRYTVRGTWREDDRADFAAVLGQMTAAARPLIEAVNAMGAAAFPLGGGLATPAEAARRSGRVSIGGLTVSAYWPHALSTAGFREAKARWRAYERAGIVSVQGLQQAGAYTFHFRKGIVGHDERALERAIVRIPGARPGRVAVPNHYAHLTDEAVGARWQRLYPGREVRVYHRTADLRIEAKGVDEAEFARIRQSVFVFLEGLVRGADRLPPAGRAADPAPPGGRRLRALQEQDPDLFHPEKYDRGATVYSVLCQGARQPEVFSESAARALPEKRRAGLVRYWNFTEKRPVYYGCPAPEYPYLHFQAGRHPLGYCLPCCKKAAALPGTRGANVNRYCLEHAGEGDPPGGAAPGLEPSGLSRHVLAYGKPVLPGRIALPPRAVAEELLFDALPAPVSLRLLGVEQSTPAVPDAGFFYSLAAAVETPPDEFAHELAATALALADTYYSLSAGAAAVFPSAEDLAAAITQTFGDASPEFSPFGPGGAAAEAWKEIFAELAGLRYDIVVATFVDPDGGGGDGVALDLSPVAAARFGGRGGLDLVLLSASPAGVYPFVAVNPLEFLRTPGSSGPARRIFSESYDEEAVADRVVEIVREMGSGGGSEAAGQAPPDLTLLLEFAAGSDYAVETKLVNLRDMCYGVILRSGVGEAVYIPVRYSAQYVAVRGEEGSAADLHAGVTARYGPRPAVPLPEPALRACLAALNEFIDRRGGAPVVPAGVLVRDGAAVGFVAEQRGGRGLSHYHDPAPLSDREDLPRIAAPYDSREVDEAIYRAGGRPALDPLPEDAAAGENAPTPHRLAAQALYTHHLYRLFVAEFAALLRDERNAEVRASLEGLIQGTRFGSAPSVAAYRIELAELLADFPADVRAIRALESAALRLSGRESAGHLRRALLDEIGASAFDFDQRTLNQLRGHPDPEETRRELDRTMRDYVVLRADGAAPAGIANMYVACAAGTSLGRPQCAGPAAAKRLVVPAGRYPDLVSILAADIRNPAKSAGLAVHTSGVIDAARFIARPGETITIRH